MAYCLYRTATVSMILNDRHGHSPVTFIFVMAALCNRAGHYIFALWFLSFFLSFFFFLFSSPNQRPQIGCLPYFHTWCDPSANLECRSEMCCRQLAEKYRTQKIAILAPSHNFVGLYIFGTKACIDNRKNLWNTNTSTSLWLSLLQLILSW